MPKPPSEETGTISGVPPNCGPRWCPHPQLPTPEQRVDIRGGLEELLRLGKTNSTQALAIMGIHARGHTRPGISEAL